MEQQYHPLRRYRGKNKEKADKQPKKVWTPEEVTAIAQYAVKSFGKIVPRNEFIKNLIDYYKWHNLSFIQVANKWDTVHKSYLVACEWRRENGQGVLEAYGDNVLHDMLLEKCPHFDILESVLRRRDSSQILVEFETPTLRENSSDVCTIDSCDIEIDEGREEQYEEAVSENEMVIESAAKKFKLNSTEATAGTAVLTENFLKNDQDRIALAYERRAVIEEQKLSILREELDLKKEEFVRKKRLDEENNLLRRLEIEKDQKIESNKYMLEVAKLSGDPGLLKLLVMDCVKSLKETN